MKHFTLLFALSMLMPLLSTPSARAGDDAANIVSSKDGKVRCELLEGWKVVEDGIGPNSIEIHNKPQDCSMLMQGLNKADLNVSLKQHAEFRKGVILNILDEGKATDPKEVKVGDYPAIQYEIEGTDRDEHERMKYLVTVLETPDQFVLCMGTSFLPQFEKAKPEMEKIMAAYREGQKTGVALAALAGDSGNIVSSKDGSLSCALPAGWKQAPTDEHPGRLVIVNPDGDCNVLFLGESKAGLDATLKQYAGNCKNFLVEGMDDVSASDPQELKIGGHDAVQYQISGIVKGQHTRVKFLLTVWGTDDRFVKCVGATTLSKFDEYKPAMESAMAGFHDGQKK